MKNIIINVDDFGMTEGINQAVFDLCDQGVVKSTTALVNSPYFKQGYEQSKNYPDLAIGIHLTIDLFNAQLFHPSLCDDKHNFHRANTHDLTRALDSAVIYREWKAQIEKFISITGHKPSHIDSHHHAHVINNDANIAVRKLGAEYNLPIRDNQNAKYQARVTGEFYNKGVTLETLKSEINNLFADDYTYNEVMCHPAYVDQELIDCSSYNQMRAVEFELLSSNQFKQYLSDNQIAVTNFK